MPQDNFCLSIVLELPSPQGFILKEEKCPSLVGERQFGRYFRRQLGEGNCESKIVSRQWGDDFCRETSRCLAGPSGLAMQADEEAEIKESPFEASSVSLM